MLEYQICSIADHQDLIPTLGRWYWEQWGPYEPEIPLERWVAKLRPRVLREAIPTIYVALAGDQPVGTASIITNDMSTHPDFTPWLAGVYVVPQFRRQGLGRALVQRVMKTAAGLDVARLYLFTESKREWYERQGWTAIGAEFYRGRDVVVMTSSTPS